MKAADLHNGIRRAIKGIQQPSIRPAQCRCAPIARFHASLPIRPLSTTSVRRAEDNPPRTTTSDARIADTEISDEAFQGPGLDDLLPYKPAPEIELDGSDPFESLIDIGSTESSVPAVSVANPPSNTEQNEMSRSPSLPSSSSSSPAPPPPQDQPVKLLSPREEERLLQRIRVVPASPSYYTSRPMFTDHYLEISALHRKHMLLPRGTRSETKIKWLSLDEYKAFNGDEPVAASRYRALIKMCTRLSTINIHLMPDEVVTALQQFTKEEQPRVRDRKHDQIDEHGRAYGLGRRKAATARAWIVRGQGNVLINGKTLNKYFTRIYQRQSALYALSITNRLGNYNVFGVVEGGGNTGQAEALTLAVARALAVYEPALKLRLRNAGCLTRDRRRVERKKPGHLKARKMPAWVKR